MTALEQLNAYLRRLQLRLGLFAASRGVALIAALALVLTVLFVWISNRYEFTRSVVFPLRVLVFLALAAAISFLLAIPLLKLNRRRTTQSAEQRVPDFQERLLTVAERPDATNPFTELIAEDALRIAREHRPEQFVETRSLFGLLGSGAIAAGFLLWLIIAGPGYWGYGASLLWSGSGSVSKRPLYDIAIQPGNKTIRRKSDQAITAQLLGFSARKVMLKARYGGAPKWDEIPMPAKADGNGYQFLFAGLSDPVEYYVQADSAQSKHYTIGVKDLPGVKRVRVALHFPSNLGLKDVVEDPGGDIRAVQGTQADVSVLTDRPLEHGLLVLDDGSKVELGKSAKSGDGNWSTALLPIKKDGAYHVAALDSGEAIRISDDYFIESQKDEPPSVRILRPGGDPHVSPIEEVPVTVTASDDFGLESLELHYSVNGGPERVMPLLKTKNAKEAQGTATLAFENFKTVPGDVVSFYASARDATKTSRSDIVFAQTEPFDFKFTQSQQAGGGMGSRGGDDEDISARQKQIIAATWNELRDTSKSRTAVQEDARFLSGLEAKLSDQAKTMADRMASRELDTASVDFQELSKTMQQASSEMSQAVDRLRPAQWNDALAPEERALQALLRVEAKFRDIQVAFGPRDRGGVGSGAQRDLARMFDLELDTTKNQYETEQSASSRSADQQKAVDEALERLKMLAKRQQELAAQNAQQQAFEQRWQEEQLRREAEELRQQMQQLSQNSQSGEQQNGSQSSSSSQSANQRGRMANGGGTSQSAQQSQAMMEAMRQALGALQRAEDEMRKAVSDRDRGAEQRASNQLREAEKALNDALHHQAGNSVADLAQRAQQIAEAQREVANRMKELYGERGSHGRNESSTTLGGEGDMPEMDDPNTPRFGYGFRRRSWQQELEPARTATPQEKALASEKEKLARQLEQLESEIQQQEKSMAGAQPETSSKLRKALSDAEQAELALRMQKNAEWLREGYGDRNVGMEDSVTAGLEQLSRKLRDVQQALKSGDQSQNGKDDLQAEALSDVRALREELERRTAEGAESQQRDQQTRNGSYSPGGESSPSISDRGMQDTLRELYGLRTQIDPRDRALHGYIDGALWNLRHLTGSTPGVLDATITRDTVASLEKLELELNKRVGQQQSTGARTGAPEPSPEKYRDAVAEYFKKLSK
ncbi:MAG: hypothetical protein JO145_12385 [Acidobacteriaceae bacterium]|nr:hypothetical protein [Acidobacteriaceae bacterium]